MSYRCAKHITLQHLMFRQRLIILPRPSPTERATLPTAHLILSLIFVPYSESPTMLVRLSHPHGSRVQLSEDTTLGSELGDALARSTKISAARWCASRTPAS